MTIKIDALIQLSILKNLLTVDFYFDKLPNDLAVITVVITVCDACLFSLSSVRRNIKKNRKKRQQLDHRDLVLWCFKAVWEMLQASVCQRGCWKTWCWCFWDLLASSGEGKGKHFPKEGMCSCAWELQRRLCGERIVDRRGRGADLCQITLSVELALGWAKLGLVGSWTRQ